MKKREEMQAGAITRDGFLGSDKRTLDEIIRVDDESVNKLGLTHRTIADRLRFFRAQGEKGLGGLVKVEPYFEVSCEMARGFLPCPFGEASRPKTRDIFAEPSEAKDTNLSKALGLPAKEGEPDQYRKTTIIVRNLRLGREIAYSDLNIHLIAEHGFYEGQGSPFRLEPDILAEVLEISG